jgi:hypothetical protein
MCNCGGGTITALDAAKGDVLKTYPCPVAERLRFSRPVNGQISVYDATGKLMFSEVLQNDEADVSGLSPGLYLYSVQTERGEARGKFLKQ